MSRVCGGYSCKRVASNISCVLISLVASRPGLKGSHALDSTGKVELFFCRWGRHLSFVCDASGPVTGSEGGGKIRIQQPRHKETRKKAMTRQDLRNKRHQSLSWSRRKQNTRSQRQ